MAKDYKHIANDRTRRRQSPPWVWLLAGLTIGLFVAFLVYLGGHGAGTSAAIGSGNSNSVSAEVVQKIPRERPQKETKSEKQPEPAKPRFEFYTILPEMEVRVPEREVTSPPPQKAQRPRADLNRSHARTAYVLQVGSFRSHQDADRLKAELALIGLRADIQIVSLGAEDTWHRVRLGPYDDLSTLDEARSRLSEHNMQAIVLKEKN